MQKAIVGLWATGQYRLPIEMGSSPVGATFASGAFRLLATTDLRVSGNVTVRMGLGGGTDIVRVQPEGLRRLHGRQRTRSRVRSGSRQHRARGTRRAFGNLVAQCGR